MSAAIVRNDGAAIQQVSEGFGTSSITRANEMATTALAAQARAQIEARYVVAMRNPRDLDTVRVKLLKECKRPGFAAVARYKKPIGKQADGRPGFIEGPSIRFAEAAIRLMGNIAAEPMVLWDDEQRRSVRVAVTDIESNVTYSTDFVVEKVVERKFLKKGQQALGTRTNSYGDLVNLVKATEDEIATKVAALVSKAMRTQGLRLVPGDIVEECMACVVETQANEIKDDPDAAKKRVLDAFAKLNIMPSALADFLGCDIAAIGPAELVDLRAIHAAISDGEVRWTDLASAAPDSEAAEGALKAVAKVKERLLKKSPAAPANKQTAGVPAVVETQGQTVVTLSFNGQISKPLAGKAVDSVSAPERAGYITDLTQAIEDLKENQPKGWEARLKAMEAHLVAVTDVHEQLAAEAAMANEG